MTKIPLGLVASCAGVAAALALSSPAHGAPSCAPDPYEEDTALTAAPLSVGPTTTRAICQAPTPQPRTQTARDEDWFAFTAPGSAAYTIQAVDVGSAIANDEFDRGGLELTLRRLGADGSTTFVPAGRTLNGDRITTPVLPAGRYVVLAQTIDTQIYPETNTMDVRTVQGSGGVYGVRLTEGAAAPATTSPAPRRRSSRRR